MSSDGTKVTTDPEGLNNPINENPGVVTSDSLAAESIQEGGSFAANSDSRGPMDQPSRSVNTNTTDVSSATRLDPAPDAEARQASEEWNEAKMLNSGLGEGKYAGRGPTWDIPPGAGPGSSGETTTTSTSQPGMPGDTELEPGFDAAHPNPVQQGTFKPKGKDITEGGFDDSAPNASFGTDIGGKNDPGRRALTDFEKENAEAAAAPGRNEGQGSDVNEFDALKETSA